MIYDKNFQRLKTVQLYESSISTPHPHLKEPKFNYETVAAAKCE